MSYLSAFSGTIVDDGVRRAFMLTDYTSFNGGASHALDSIPTFIMAVGARASVLNGDAIFYYVLIAGANVESVPNYIRPDDYNVGTNAKVWKLIAASQGSIVSGQIDLEAGVDSYTVTGLGLASVPRVVIPIIQIPESSGLLLHPVLQGPPTQDGFTVYFSGGQTDSSDYKLNYLIFL